MDTFQLDNLTPRSFPAGASTAPFIAMKLGLFPKERPVSHLQLLIEETLAPHIHIIDSRTVHPLVEFDVESFVDAAIDSLVAREHSNLEDETCYSEAA